MNNQQNRIVIGWGAGSLGLATILNTFNVLLLAYLTVVLGLEPALAGSLILIAKLYDIVTDLPMGWLTDRTRSRWGARRPYLLVAGFVTPVALVWLFSPLETHVIPQVLGALLLYATGYTLFNVPYLSMPAEIAHNVVIRNRMIAYRSAFIAVGTFFGISVAPYLVGTLGGGSEGYERLGQVMGVVVFIAFVACFLFTGTPQRPVTAQKRVAVSTQLRVMLKNRHFIALMLIKITHLLALSVGAGSLFFFMRYTLGYDLKTLGIYGAATTLAWFISMPFWTRIANQRGKRFGYFVATAAYVVVTLTWLLAVRGEPMGLLLTRGLVLGFISGGMLMMGNAMLQDVMDDDYRSTGERKNGLFAGSYSMVEKITSGFGAQILGFVLSATGFQHFAAEQSATAIKGTYITIALIPAILMLISLLAIRMYRLDEKVMRTASNECGL